MIASKMRGYLAVALLGSGESLVNTDNNHLFAQVNRYIPNESKFRKVRKKGKLTLKQNKARNKSKAARKARRKNK